MYKRPKKKQKIQAIIAILICFACVLYYRDTDFATELDATLTDAKPASVTDADMDTEAEEACATQTDIISITEALAALAEYIEL